MNYCKKPKSYFRITLTLFLVSASIFAKTPLTSEIPTVSDTQFKLINQDKSKSAEIASDTQIGPADQDKPMEHRKFNSDERPFFLKAINIIRHSKDNPESKICPSLSELEDCLAKCPDLVHCYNDREETLLAIAAKFEKSHIAKFFIEHGADVNFPDINGNTPLLISVKNFNNKSASETIATVVILLTLGADIDHKNNNHYDAYQLACTLPHLPLTILNILIRYYGHVHYLTTKLKYK